MCGILGNETLFETVAPGKSKAPYVDYLVTEIDLFKIAATKECFISNYMDTLRQYYPSEILTSGK
jgi:hypothetical protein